MLFFVHPHEKNVHPPWPRKVPVHNGTRGRQNMIPGTGMSSRTSTMSTQAKNHRIRSNNPCTSLKTHTTMSTSINSLAECETTTVSTQAKNLRVQTILACFQSPHNDINVSPATAECRQGPQRCQRKRRTIGSNQTNLASFQKPQRTERPTTESRQGPQQCQRKRSTIVANQTFLAHIQSPRCQGPTPTGGM